MPKWTASRIRTLKKEQAIVCLTAYDAVTARLEDEAGVHIILVGDSVAMTALGYPSTLSATLDDMLRFTAAVARGTTDALVVADMPFLSYQVSIEEGIRNAGRFLQEAGAQAVKIEGGKFRAQLIETLTNNGIPVLGHIGLTPQSIHELGGYKVQGRDPQDARKLLDDARALEAAGAFAVVLECLPAELAAEITAAVNIPTIGIGAGPHCDGQVLVVHDLLGLSGDKTPRFAKKYADLTGEMRRAFSEFKSDVQAGRFPSAEHSY